MDAMDRNDRLLGVAACLLALAGCASTTPQWDARFGEATRATLASQVADPAAARKPRAAVGIDGAAARATQQQYEASFAAPPPPPPSLSIGIGGAK
jgi:hypothetical protein